MVTEKCKPKTRYSLNETRDMIKEFVWQSGTGQDPINTNILKNKLYVRRINGSEKTSLSFEQAYALGAFIADMKRGQLVPELYKEKKTMYEIRAIGVAVALQTAGLTATEIAGINSGVFDWDILEYVNPKSENVLDNCGMGGDDLFTPNISTVALLTASNYKGIKTCKHGSPGNTDAAGSSDFSVYLIKQLGDKNLEDLVLNKKMGGYMTEVSSEKMAKIIDDVSFGYIEAIDPKYKTIHTQTHFLAEISHINDILGPVTLPINPEKVTKKIIGVNHLVKPSVVAEAYKIMNEKNVTNLKDGYIIRGTGQFGMDEFSILGPTEVAEIKNGDAIETYYVTPEDFGLKTHMPNYANHVNGRTLVEGISPSFGENKKETSLKLIKDEIQGPQRDFTLMNVAPILKLYNLVSDFKEGVQVADELMRQKNGYNVAKNFVEALAKYEN